MSMCRVISCIVGRRCLLWPVCSLGKTLSAFVWLHLVLQDQTCLLLQVSLYFLLHFKLLMWKAHLLFFFGANPRTSCRSSWNHSTSYVSSLVFGAWIWISVILNGLPWKQAEMILSLLKLYPSNAFQILLFTTRATPLLLMDPSPHVWLFVTLETVVHQAPPSMRFSRQEIWYG